MLTKIFVINNVNKNVMNFIKKIKTELILSDRTGKCYLEIDFNHIKFVPPREGPQPYEIPLPCLISMLNLPTLQTPWTAESLEQYSELHEIGFNIYHLKNNKATVSPNFPGIALL